MQRRLLFQSCRLGGILLLLITPIFINAGGGPGGKKSPQPCPTLQNKTIPLNILWDGVYANGCSIPEYFSNPSNFSGTNDPSETSKYYLKITVIPNIPSNCSFDPNQYTFYWLNPGQSMNITVPKNASSRVIVEFYERCHQVCNSSLYGRRYSKSESTIYGSEGFLNAVLKYTSTLSC